MKVPHACKIAPTPPTSNLSFISLSPFLSTPSSASPPERTTPPGKMRIETARDKITGPARQISRDSSGCPGSINGSKRRLYHQTEPQAPARGQAAGQLRTQKTSRATENTKKRSGNRKCELIGQPCAMHQPLAQALSLAWRRCCRRPAFPATPNPAPRKHPHPPASQQRAPRLPRNTPNHHATARLVAHFSRKTAETKVTHITN